MTTSTSERTPVFAADAPAAVAAYSHAVRYGALLFCSGQVPLIPGEQTLVADSLAAETRQCLENLAAVCRAAGADLARAVRMTVYTTQMEGFAEINEAYVAWFPSEPPARVAIGVAALSLDARGSRPAAR